MSSSWRSFDPRKVGDGRDPNDIPGDLILTQYGTTAYFRAAPRFEDYDPPEHTLSMFVGRLMVGEAYRYMVGLPAPSKGRVRYFNAGTLREHRYWVYRSPSKHNPLHVSVAAPFQDIEGDEARSWWSNESRPSLDSLAIE